MSIRYPRSFMWSMFMAARLGRDESIQTSAEAADKALVEFDKRFFRDASNEQWVQKPASSQK